MHTLKKKGLVNVLTAFVFSVVCVYRKLKRLELDTLFLKQRRDGRKKDTKRGGETKCGLMKEFCFSFVKRKKKGRKYRWSWAWNRREWSRTGWPGMAEQTVEQKQKKEEIICKIRPTSLKSEIERELRRLNTIGCTGRRYVYNKWNIFGRETGYSFRQWLHCPGETMGNSYVLKRMYPKHPNVNFNPYESSFNWSGGMNSLAWYSFSPSSFIHTDYARRHLTRQSFPMFMQQKKKKALSEIDISETLLFLISGDIAALRQEKGWSWLSQSGKERKSETMGRTIFFIRRIWILSLESSDYILLLVWDGRWRQKYNKSRVILGREQVCREQQQAYTFRMLHLGKTQSCKEGFTLKVYHQNKRQPNLPCQIWLTIVEQFTKETHFKAILISISSTAKYFKYTVHSNPVIRL